MAYSRCVVHGEMQEGAQKIIQYIHMHMEFIYMCTSFDMALLWQKNNLTFSYNSFTQNINDSIEPLLLIAPIVLENIGQFKYENILTIITATQIVLLEKIEPAEF